MVLRPQGPVGMLLHHSRLINPLSAVIYQLYPFTISKSVMKGQVVLLCSLSSGPVAIMLYYCTPLRCMEESGESTWDASLVSRAWQISINSAPSTSGHDGDYQPLAHLPPVFCCPFLVACTLSQELHCLLWHQAAPVFPWHIPPSHSQRDLHLPGTST